MVLESLDELEEAELDDVPFVDVEAAGLSDVVDVVEDDFDLLSLT